MRKKTILLAQALAPVLDLASVLALAQVLALDHDSNDENAPMKKNAFFLALAPAPEYVHVHGSNDESAPMRMMMEEECLRSGIGSGTWLKQQPILKSTSSEIGTFLRRPV